MKNYLIIFSLIFLAEGCTTIDADYNKKFYVEFEPIAIIKAGSLSKASHTRTATVFQYQSQFDHILNDSSDVYFAFRNKIPDSLLNFNKYDYVFSYGREIDSLSHSKAFTEKYDACSIKVKTALQKIYKQGFSDSLLFIYRLKAKNLYADPCG